MSLIPTQVTQTVAKNMIKARAHSPRAFFVVGVAGVLGGTFLACRATLKLDKTTKDIKASVDEVKVSLDEGDINPEEYRKQLTYAYARGGVELAKLYGPSVLLIGGSIASLAGSHVALTRRYAAMSTAYAAVTESMDHYRDRVRDVVGEEEESLLYHAAEWQDVPGSDGKVQELVADAGKWSPYARFFDETNRNWVNDSKMNEIFIEGQEHWANQKLNAVGVVFLNEVYENLGLAPTSVGQMVGWVMGGDGDNYIDFGTMVARDAKISPITGGPPSLLLDFNVDGQVFEMLDELFRS